MRFWFYVRLWESRIIHKKTSHKTRTSQTRGPRVRRTSENVKKMSALAGRAFEGDHASREQTGHATVNKKGSSIHRRWLFMEIFVLFWFWHPGSNGSLDPDVEDSRTVFKCFWSRAQTKPLSITDIQYLKATMSIRGENYTNIDRKSGQHWFHFDWCVVSVLCIPMITKFPNPQLTFVHLCLSSDI